MLGCVIEPAPGSFSLFSSSLSICPRYVVVNQLPASLQLRADLIDSGGVSGKGSAGISGVGDAAMGGDAPHGSGVHAAPQLLLPAHVELAPGTSTDIYCFESLAQLPVREQHRGQQLPDVEGL